MKVKNPMNYVPKKGKVFTQLSKTIPDQSLPLATILDRHSRGLPIDVAMRTPIYEGENEESQFGGININTLDLAEIEQLQKQNAQDIIDTKNQIEYEKSEKIRIAKEKKDASTRNQTSTFEKSTTTDQLPGNSNDGNGNA